MRGPWDSVDEDGETIPFADRDEYEREEIMNDFDSQFPEDEDD